MCKEKGHEESKPNIHEGHGSGVLPSGGRLVHQLELSSTLALLR